MLFRNDGNLNFTNVTNEAGLSATGLWMGLAFGDYDLDGDFDLFATNVGTSREDIEFRTMPSTATTGMAHLRMWRRS